MPVKYEYVDNKQGVIITAIDDITGEEFIKAIKEIFRDEQTIRNYKYGLVDYTKLGKFDISLSQIADLANIHISSSKYNPNIIVGFAITQPLIHGLVRVWKTYAAITGWKIDIKKSVPEIRSWINNTLEQG